VVLASGGYPGKYHTGYPISGLDEVTAMPDVYVFHAGTSRRGDEIVTAGGRVVAVSAIASKLPDALDRAYTAVQSIHFEGMHYRKDIGRSTQEVTR
jgi:phosphoribosylamine--glycine ligase